MHKWAGTERPNVRASVFGSRAYVENAVDSSTIVPRMGSQ